MTNKFECDIPNMEAKLPILDELLKAQIGYSIEGEAKQNAPVDTGVYRNNISYNGRNQVIAHSSYSASIEYGTQPHTIEARTAQALHFKINGQDVFAKSVNHPGTKPNPVMRNAARTVMKRDFNRIFKESWNNVIKKGN